MIWTEKMVGDLHTGVWISDGALFSSRYEFRECVSCGPLYWIVGDIEMKLVNPKGEQYGFELEGAKQFAQKHHYEFTKKLMELE